MYGNMLKTFHLKRRFSVFGIFFGANKYLSESTDDNNERRVCLDECYDVKKILH